MVDNECFFPQVQAPTESEVVDISKVKLNYTWVFWENYEGKLEKYLDYTKSVKDLFKFSDILTFWQFWNNYPGSSPANIFYNGERLKYFYKEKYRITGLNLFKEGIAPTWEDTHNKGGKTLSLEYNIRDDIQSFLTILERSWILLMVMLVGESIPSSEFINGIRLVDKTILGKKILYRIEVWLMPQTPEAKLTELTAYLRKEFGSEIQVKPIT